MAYRDNVLRFREAQFSFEEDGRILIHVIKSDSVETFDFTEVIREYTGDNRFVEVFIRERYDIEGIES